MGLRVTNRLVVVTIVVAIVIAGTLLSSYFAAGDGHNNDNQKLVIVTSVSPLCSIIKNVGGDRIDVVALVPEGADSHTFELSVIEGVVVKTRADIVIINGLNLEPTIEEAASQSDNRDVKVLKLADNTIGLDQWVFDGSFPEERGDPNPHLWLNVEYVMRYAELVRDELSRADPANADYYAENTEHYLARLQELDGAIAASVKTIPEENRRLFTYHDSWPYFAKRYGMTIIGVVQPSHFGEPTEEEVSKIIEQIRAENVHAIFASEVFPSDQMDRIANEAEVVIIQTLRDDDLPGDVDSPQHTYVGMMIENVRTMVSALGGNPSFLDDVDPSDAYQKR